MQRLRGTLHGAAWGGAAKLVQAVAALSALALIARDVGPQAWGLYALAWVVAGLVEVVVFAVPTEALAQRPRLRTGHLTAVFTAAGAVGLVAAGAVTAAARPIADALGGGAALAALLPWRMLAVPVVAATAAPAALLSRHARFGRIAAIEVGAGLAGSLAGILAVSAGLGVWSLIAMELVRIGVWSVAIWLAARWRPTRRCRLADLRDLGGFSSRAWLGWMVLHLDQQLPRIAIGAALGPQALGLYALAERLLVQANQVLIGPVYQTVTVAAARLQQDAAAVRAVYVGALRALATIAMPAYLGAAVLAPTALPLLLGEAWAPAAGCAALSMLLGVRSVTTALDAAVLRGIGRVGLHLAVVVAGTLGIAVALPWVAPFGPQAVIAMLIVRSLMLGPVLGRMLGRSIGIGLREQAACWAGPLVAAIAMAAVVAAVLPSLHTALGDGGALAAAIVSGALAYPLALRILAPAHVATTLARMAPRVSPVSRTAQPSG